jgi:hypothetical protein
MAKSKGKKSARPRAKATPRKKKAARAARSPDVPLKKAGRKARSAKKAKVAKTPRRTKARAARPVRAKRARAAPALGRLIAAAAVDIVTIRSPDVPLAVPPSEEDEEASIRSSDVPL